MSDWLLLLILVLATYRVTRLITTDDFPPIYWLRWKIITARPSYVRTRDNQQMFWWLGELVSCPWCASGWVSLGLVGGVWLTNGLTLPILWWFAAWGGGALVTSKLESE